MRFATLLALCASLLAGCASEVIRSPSQLDAASGSPVRRYVVTEQVAFRLDSGNTRTIAAGTEFVRIGALRQGFVLKPTRTVMTVEGAHMHEAYLVVDRERIVGFYLPVEQAYSPLSIAVSIPLQQREIAP
jgi:hypothetical protein